MKRKREFMISEQLAGEIWDAAGPFGSFEAASQYLAGAPLGEFLITSCFTPAGTRLRLIVTSPAEMKLPNSRLANRNKPIAHLPSWLYARGLVLSELP
jgi:hypothetical protein